MKEPPDYTLAFAPTGEPYLEHRGDGKVFCRWPDGSFKEVVPAESAERLRALLWKILPRYRELFAYSGLGDPEYDSPMIKEAEEELGRSL